MSDGDGNIWATQSNGKIAKIASDGTSTAYTVAGSSDALGTAVRGWDGEVWFADVANNEIDEITTSGVVTSYVIPTSNSDPGSLIDNDNPMSMVFIEQDNGSVAAIDYAGNVTEYSASNPTFLTADADGGVWYANDDMLYLLNAGTRTYTDSPIQEMAAASGGGVWFLNSDGLVNEVGHAFANGTIDYYRLTNSNSNFPSLVSGPDGAWFIIDDASGSGGNSVIGTVSSGGAISEFTIPSTVALQDLTVSSDGSLWATDASTNVLTRIVTNSGSYISGKIHGHSFSSTVASFNDHFNPLATAGSYTATIDWGDGTSSSGTVIASTDPKAQAKIYIDLRETVTSAIFLTISQNPACDG